MENESLIRNLEFMRKIALQKDMSETDIPSNIRKLLSDLQFEEKLKLQIAIQEPICNYIDRVQARDCPLSEACELWFDIKYPQDKNKKKKSSSKGKEKSLSEKKAHRDDQIFDITTLISHSFDPRYRGKKFSDGQKGLVYNWALKKLNSNDLNIFYEFIEMKKNFAPGNFHFEDDPFLFWRTIKETEPDYVTVADLALQYISLPASTAQLERLFSMWQHVHSLRRNRLTQETSQNLTKVYHTLKTSKK
jgi:hypothetical protein